jgi:hypothetical protein
VCSHEAHKSLFLDGIGADYIVNSLFINTIDFLAEIQANGTLNRRMSNKQF